MKRFHFLSVFLIFVFLNLNAAATPVMSTGMYLGPGCVGVKRVEAYAKWLGRTPERASDFFSDHSWIELIKAAERSTRCWTATGLPMSFAVPMLPRNPSATLEKGAAGEYDAYFVRVAEILVKNNQADAVIRIGWEFNNTWFSWRADKDPAAWVKYWRRIVTAMRSVPGSNFKFDWCTAWGKGAIEPPLIYPGDDFVDIIGMDVYNTSWNPLTPQERWKLKLSAPFGLMWQKEFASSRGKPVSFPEWGTGMRPDGRGGGDDPYFIQKMAEWIRSSNVAYHNYWDFPAPDFNAILSDGSKPEAAAAFLEIFGGSR